MSFLWMAVLLGIGIVIFVGIKLGVEEGFFTIVGLIPVIFVAYIISMLIANVLADHESVLKEEIPLVALQSGSSNDGVFFLGIGPFGSKNKYYFMKQTEKGMLQDSENADKVYVIEDDSVEPKISYYTAKPVGNKFIREFGFDKKGDIVITIPTNSLVREFEIGLDN